MFTTQTLAFKNYTCFCDKQNKHRKLFVDINILGKERLKLLVISKSKNSCFQSQDVRSRFTVFTAKHV